MHYLKKETVSSKGLVLYLFFIASCSDTTFTSPISSDQSPVPAPAPAPKTPEIPDAEEDCRCLASARRFSFSPSYRAAVDPDGNGCVEEDDLLDELKSSCKAELTSSKGFLYNTIDCEYKRNNKWVTVSFYCYEDKASAQAACKCHEEVSL